MSVDTSMSNRPPADAKEAQTTPATLRTKPLDPVLRPPLPSKKRPAPAASKLVKDHRRDVKRAKAQGSQPGHAAAAAAAGPTFVRPAGTPAASQSNAAAAAKASADAEYARQVDAARKEAQAAAPSKPDPPRRPIKGPSTARRGPAQQHQVPLAQVPVDELERQVLCGRLWHAECQQLGAALPNELPLAFASQAEYVAAFEPLLFEEARESTRSEWNQNCERGWSHVVDIGSMEEQGSGWHLLRLRSPQSLHQVRDGSVVVLTRDRPPIRGALDWLKKSLGEGEVVAGIARLQRKGNNSEVPIAIAPSCPAHKSGGGCCTKVLETLRSSPRQWYLVALWPLTTQEREFRALQYTKHCAVLEHILQPGLLQQWKLSREDVSRMWPAELRQPAFIDFLRSQYDETQLHAIEVAAAHLKEGVDDHRRKALPFILIQGPPGTGKTHTVKGVLNVWSLVAYQRYYKSLMEALTSDRSKRAVQDSLQNALGRTLPNLVQKPRILVCAHSNAATDELLERVMRDGFAQAEGGSYRPNVVRIGAEEAISPMARHVWTDCTIDGLLQMDPGQWEAEYHQHVSRVQRLSTLCVEYQKTAASIQTEVEVLEKSLARQTDSQRAGMIKGQLHSKQHELQQHARELVGAHEGRDRSLVQIHRLEEAQAHVGGHGNAAGLRLARENLEFSLVSEADMVFTTLSSTGRRNIFSKLENAFETVLVDEAAQASEIAVLQPLLFGCKRAVLVGDPQQLPATVLSKGAQLLERSMFERLQRAGCPVNRLSIQYRMHPSIRQFPSRYFYNNELQDGPNILKSVTGHPLYDNPLLAPYTFFDVSSGRETRQGRSLRNQAEADLAACLFWEVRSFLEEAAARGRPLKAPLQVGVVTPYKQQKACLQETFKALCGEQIAAEVLIQTVDSFQGKQMDIIIMSCVRATTGGGSIGFVNDVRRLNVAITRAKLALWILGSRATLQVGTKDCCMRLGPMYSADASGNGQCLLLWILHRPVALQGSPVWKALLDDASLRGLVMDDVTAQNLFEHVESSTKDKLEAMLETRSQQQKAQQHQQALEQGQ